MLASCVVFKYDLAIRCQRGMESFWCVELKMDVITASLKGGTCQQSLQPLTNGCGELYQVGASLW